MQDTFKINTDETIHERMIDELQRRSISYCEGENYIEVFDTSNSILSVLQEVRFEEELMHELQPIEW